MYYAQETVDDFLAYLHEREPGSPSDFFSLSEAFTEWMINGDAIDATAGDYVLFLQVFVLAAARLAEKPEDFGRHREFIKAVVQLDNPDTLPSCLDRDYWNLFVFRRKYGSHHR